MTESHSNFYSFVQSNYYVILPGVTAVGVVMSPVETIQFATLRRCYPIEAVCTLTKSGADSSSTGLAGCYSEITYQM